MIRIRSSTLSRKVDRTPYKNIVTLLYNESYTDHILQHGFYFLSQGMIEGRLECTGSALGELFEEGGRGIGYSKALTYVVFYERIP